MNKIILLFFSFFCINSFAQKKEDFKLITFFQDTLFSGYQNELTIETNWDKSRLSLTGIGVQISTKANKDKYIITANRPSKTCEIILKYRKSSSDILTFNYSFIVIPLAPQMIIRVHETALLYAAPETTESETANQYPKQEDFKLISFFQDTLILNERNEISVQTKWDKSKIYLAIDGRLAAYNKEKDVYYVSGGYSLGQNKIKLGYMKSKTERFYFDFPVVTVALNRELNNRRRVAGGLEKIPDDQPLKEDVKLITFFQDTLVIGYDNNITIETTWENLDIYLEYSGNYNFIKYYEQEGCYRVNPGNYTGYEKIELYLNKNDTLRKSEIKYSFAIVTMNPEMNARLKKALSIPLDEEFTLTKIPSARSQGKVELVLQKSVPDNYSPIFISKNKEFAFLYNSDIEAGSIMDLKNKKLVISEHKILNINDGDEGILSNTGRYLCLRDYWQNPLLHDIFTGKDLIQNQNFFNKYVHVEIEQFSSDDYYYTYFGLDTLTEYYMMSVASISGNFNAELHTTGNSPKASYFKSDNSVLSVCSYNWQNSKSPTYYIDSVDFRKNTTVLKDSICLSVEPFEVKIENSFLIIGYLDTITKSITYLFYDLENYKLISELALKPGFHKPGQGRLFTCINPEGTRAIIGIEGKGKKGVTEFYFYNLLSHYLNKNPVTYNPGHCLREPILLSNDELFAEYTSSKLYLDSPTDQLFWYNYITKTYNDYVPSLTLYSDDWGFTNPDNCPLNCSTNSIPVVRTFYKNGMQKEETIYIKVDSLNHSTFRFGTKIMTKASRHFGIYEFDLGKLKLTSLHEFKEYTPSIQSDEFFNGAYSCNSILANYQDSLVQLHVDPNNDLWQFEEPQLIQVHDSTKLIYADKKNSGFFFYNFEKKKLNQRVVHFVILKTNEWILYTDDMYYACSFIDEPVFQFSMEGKLYPFEQFDLKYNRPDIILDRLGYADPELINAYHQAYLKRLKKMGFTEDMLKDDLNLPQINIENYESIPLISNDDSIKLNIKLEDKNHPLDRINIWINDVAIFGTNGISLRPKNVQNYQTSLNIPLAFGKNNIQISALNQAGVESYKETIEIECATGKKQPDLYLITIGISDYKDSRYNLTYASKDAIDMTTTFQKNKFYMNVFSKTLTDSQVVLENLSQLKSFLAPADINDQVIIFVAGHGVLDANFDYYFASYDMNFQNPSARGIPYEMIESLLDGIKPLKKLLFMDTCHSGEVDKDEIQVSENSTESENDIVFRNVGVAVENKENQLGLQNTSELMKSLFTDLRKGTGATVISSAGGVEFAMESDTWQNGLFTYCLIDGLINKKADLNNDKMIMVSELQTYIQVEVNKLSNGKQTPTSRIENNEMDYRVW